MFTPDIPAERPAPLKHISRIAAYQDQYGTAIDGIVPFQAIIQAKDPEYDPRQSKLIDAVNRSDKDRRKRAASITEAQSLADSSKIFVSEQYQFAVYDDHPKLKEFDLKKCDFAELLQAFGPELLKVDGGTRHLAHRNLIEGTKVGKKKTEGRPEFNLAPVKVCLHIIPRQQGLFLTMFTHFNSDRTKIKASLMDLIRGARFAWEEERSRQLTGADKAASEELLKNAKKNEIIAMLADPGIPQFAGMVLLDGESDDATQAKKQAGCITNAKLSAAIDGCIKTAKWNDGEFGHNFNALASTKLIRVFKDLVNITDTATDNLLFEPEALRRWFGGAFNTMFKTNVSATMLLVKRIYDTRKVEDDTYTVSEAVKEAYAYVPALSKVLAAEMERPEASLRYSGETTSAAQSVIWTKVQKDVKAIKL
jgi:hypothetical protein